MLAQRQTIIVVCSKIQHVETWNGSISMVEYPHV